ncbi:TIGR03118 family protein [Edaphobacter albus]|uniref:TIGR03118 family protein n=1 Tax=Edaphobacter sp. 4G125 TaxID=2763071 RepID=UPI0016492969|nr:TIGR03118 family protein [Edaphobacter sp. 4G125]QNI37111.1 TIGR03118 family protein [Edaphobacter sp. 4G125]
MLGRIHYLAPLLLLPGLAQAQTGNSYTQSNLISDGSVKAQQTDPNLINPWGVAIGQQTPFWINTTGTGLSEVYDGGANKQFIVTIPPAAGSKSKSGSPTGIAFNSSTTDFVLKQGSSALFLFDSLDGTISAWNSSLTNAVTVVDNSAAGAVYTGLAIANNSTANFILTANLASGKIDVFDTKFAPANLASSFTDPTIPQGFAPFNVHVLNNQVYVMYAMQTPGGGPPTAGAGAGYISIFDTNGNFIKRAISGGNLNAPWGLVLAPASFGPFGGDLLVGNFGDGTINAFDPSTFALKGQLQDANGKVIVNDRLWEILFGENGTGDPNTLYFSAGINDEKGGLFGAITAAAPTPAGDFQIAASTSSLTVTQGTPGTIQINITPANGFGSAVSLTASGLPTGLTFQFSPSSVTPTAGKAASSTLTISGNSSTPTPTPPTNPYSTAMKGSLHSRMLLAGSLFPIGLAGLFPVIRRRRKAWKSMALCSGAFLTIALTLGGCSGATKSSSTPSSTPPVTPGTSMVTVTATSGSIVHTTTIALTVQ